ncbi:ribonuclease H-like domain-containing protein [Tanacetum coccineum]|uniref:Ribonuclease H-like domain-containing protein n=1 Tax=Tanacetum coccineum TaxID=301880 RepID=A0ABQ5A3L3_9ASTR
MSAHDDFSLHDDEELSLHDDASLAGSLPASNKGDAPAKPPQIITTNTLSNIKLPVLQKDDYDTWAMEMEHYLEYIDNEVWKVIQNGNSKKRVTKGKDGVYRVLPPTTQEEQFADEKERKARTLLLMAVPKDHLRRFHGMDDAKEIWAAIKTRFGGNANSKKMQKAVLKQQFEAFTISSKESLEKGYDRFQKLLSQLVLLVIPHAVLWILIHEDLDQIDDLDLEEMDINWQIAMTAIKIKKFYKKTGRRPRVDGKMHVAFDKRKVECFNCHNTGHFARECKFKGSKEGSRQEADSYNALQAKYDELQSEFGNQEAALVAHKIAVKKLESQLKASHKQQSSLTEKLNFQANQILKKDCKAEKYRRIGMEVSKDKVDFTINFDSWSASSKNLWKLLIVG